MTWRSAATTPSLLLGAALALALVGWWLVSPHDPNDVDLGARLAWPSVDHPLGTDQLGRDVATRLAHGSVVTLALTAGTHLTSAIIGTGIGMALAWSGGWTGRIGAAAIDTLVALPDIIIALTVVAIIGPGITGLAVAVLTTAWLPFARTTQQVTTQILGHDYVEAAASIGAGRLRILVGTVAPNAARPLLAYLWLRFPGKLVLVTGLAFLGLGPRPPTPEWGTALAEAVPYLERNPVPTLTPAIAILATGLAAGAVGRQLEIRLD